MLCVIKSLLVFLRNLKSYFDIPYDIDIVPSFFISSSLKSAQLISRSIALAKELREIRHLLLQLVKLHMDTRYYNHNRDLTYVSKH